MECIILCFMSFCVSSFLIKNSIFQLQLFVEWHFRKLYTLPFNVEKYVCAFVSHKTKYFLTWKISLLKLISVWNKYFFLVAFFGKTHNSGNLENVVFYHMTLMKEKARFCQFRTKHKNGTTSSISGRLELLFNLRQGKFTTMKFKSIMRYIILTIVPWK